MKIEKHGGNIYKYDHKMYDFSANLNPLGMPEVVKQAVIDHMDDYESYPDPECREIRRAIADYHGTEPERICCGNGAADLIFRIAMAFRPKKALIIGPAFSEYGEALELAGSEIDYYILKEENGFQMDDGARNEIRLGKYDMVFLCSPANPTGVPVQKEQVMALVYTCTQAGTRMILDECFMEFVMGEEEYSILPEISKLSHVIILKSFTKIFAMAGLRLGYCVCGSTEDAEAVRLCMQSWPVSTASAAAGIAALSQPDFVDETKAYVALQRESLIGGLFNLGFRVYPSRANYVFFHSDIPLDEPLLEHDILIRNCSNYAGLSQGYYRVAVRTEEENQYLLQVLADIVKK